MTPEESHIKAAIIGLWRQGAKPGQIEDKLYGQIVKDHRNLVQSTVLEFVKKVIASHKPKK